MATRVFRRRYPDGRVSRDFYMRFTDERGQRVFRSTGKTERREAQEVCDDANAEARARRRDPFRDRGQGRERLADFVKLWLEREGPRLAESERPGRRRRLEKLVAFFGRSARLCDVTRERLEAYRSARLRAGKKPGTVNRELAALKAVMRTAVQWRRLPFSDIHGVKQLKEEGARFRSLTRTEAEALVAAARESKNPVLAPLILAALNTGARRGELLSLRWSDIGETETGAFVIFRKTKARIPRQVPVTAATIRLLRSLPRTCEHVFAYEGRPLKEFTRAFQVARRRAGLGPDVVFHTLRHTFATQLAANGVHVSEIQRLTGHSTLKVLERYLHPSREALRSAVTGLDLGYQQEVVAIG